VQHAIATELDPAARSTRPNRIESIYGIARALEQLSQGADRGSGHGADARARTRAGDGRASSTARSTFFVSTTITRHGIDIPNVNTIVVNDADKFGLAQLYQLRGRVGRSITTRPMRSCCTRRTKALIEEAKARLEAIASSPPG